MKKFKKIFIIILLITIIILFPKIILAANADLESFESTISGTSNTPNIVSIITGFYSFALVISGILAMGAIIYGAILYTISSGNTSRQSDAKEWITQAFVGLLLLLGANLFLSTINVTIVKPTITAPQVTSEDLQRTNLNTSVTMSCNSCTTSTAASTCFDSSKNAFRTCSGQPVAVQCSACTTSTAGQDCYNAETNTYNKCPMKNFVSCNACTTSTAGQSCLNGTGGYDRCPMKNTIPCSACTTSTAGQDCYNAETNTYNKCPTK